MPLIPIEIAVLLLVIAGLLARAAAKVAVGIVVVALAFYLIALFFPIIAAQAGAPGTTLSGAVHALLPPTATPLPTATPVPSPTPVKGINDTIFQGNGALGIRLASVTFYDDTSSEPGAFSATFDFPNRSSDPVILSIDWDQWRAVDSTGVGYNWIRAMTMPPEWCGISVAIGPPAGAFGSSSAGSSAITRWIPGGQSATTAVQFVHCSSTSQRIAAGAQWVKIWIEQLGTMVKPTFVVPVQR